MTQKWAIVAGSSSGIGYALSAHLLELGYKVAGGSRSGTDIDHDDFLDFELDVTDEKSVYDFFVELRGLTPKIDLFINTAGICELASIQESSAETFKNHWQVYAMGGFHLLRGVESFIIPRQTQMLFFLPIGTKIGLPQASSFISANASLKGLLDSVRKEWRSMSVRMTQIYLGAVDTHLWHALDENIPHDKMLKVEDVVNMVDYIIQSPAHCSVHELTLVHREGFFD